MTEPRLTVVIPFYNETAFIENAVRSVIAQKIDDIEVIIVNDNPLRFDPDYFEGLAFPDCVRVVHHAENRGLSAARNTGIAEARGVIIGFLDADDYYLPGGLARQLEYAEETDADFTHGQAVVTNIGQPSGNVLGAEKQFLNHKAVLLGHDILKTGFEIISSWSSLYRREFLTESGVIYDVEQRKFEDRLFIVDSLIAAKKVAILGQPVRVWRRRAGSITTSSKSLDEALMKLALLEKCVAAWWAMPSSDNRYWAALEFVRQIKGVIFANQVSAWRNAFNQDAETEFHVLNERLSAFSAKQDFTEAEITEALRLNVDRFAKTTGRGKISPADFNRFVSCVKAGDYKAAQEIADMARNPSSGREIPARNAVATFPDIRFVIHIGLHKTGSTFVQYQLDANRDALRKGGVLFPKTGFGFPKGRHPVRPSGLPGHQELLRAINNEDHTILKALHKEIAQSDCHTVVISAENLSMPMANTLMRARSFIRVLNAIGAGDNVDVVAMFRRPEAWIESLYREHTCNGNRIGYQTAPEFALNNFDLLNLPALFSAFEEATGRPVLLTSFDAAVQGAGLVPAFLKLCNLDPALADGFSDRPEANYPSPCNAQVSVAHTLVSLEPSTPLCQSLLRNFFALTTPTEQTASILPQEDRLTIIDKFEELSGAFLAERGRPVDFEVWRQTAEQEASAPVPQIPAEYLTVLSQSGIWERGWPPEQIKWQSAWGGRAPRGNSRAGFDQMHAAELNVFSEVILSDAPRPVRWFVRTYHRLTHNAIYRRLRFGTS